MAAFLMTSASSFPLMGRGVLGLFSLCSRFTCAQWLCVILWCPRAEHLFRRLLNSGALQEIS